MQDERAALLEDRALTGAEWCRAQSDLFDCWLRDLFSAAADGSGGMALVAVGGYGRAELCPCSDLDVLLLHTGGDGVKVTADRLWYPIWDAGMKLGHSVRTVKEALSLAQGDLDTATSLLTTRHLAGDRDLSDALGANALAQWRKRAKRWLSTLEASVAERHRRWGDVAFLLEPDLKQSAGGLRDVHALKWAQAAGLVLFEGDTDNLASAYQVLLAARVELHRLTGRPSDLLTLQDQDGVAAALGDADADVLMARVAGAARTIAWTGGELWRAVRSTLGGPAGRLARRDRELAPGVILRDGEVHLAADATVLADPVLPLRAAASAAAQSTTIHRSSLERLARELVPLSEPWPAEGRQRLAELFLAGRPAVPVVESLDQRGVWVTLIPEWSAVRSRPQRNAYHTFTVDRHLVEAAVGAAALADRVDRPDLLVTGALLHDLGKGYPGDHTEVGMGLARDLGGRMGFPAADVDILVAMVQHHLLLPDVATRRDLDDPGTISLVAEAIGDVGRLRLLAALTEADSRATGPAAWGTWKARLVADLVERTAHVLSGGEATEVAREEFPSPELQALMARGERVVDGTGDILTVVSADRPGLFSRAAGVLALHGLEVRDAHAVSSEDGMALACFHVDGDEARWDRVVADLGRCLDGGLALDARLSERAARYYSQGSSSAGTERPTTSVTFDNAASEVATVVDVQAHDGLGVLYRITRALADLDLDIRSARVQTLGPRVVDAFYVRDGAGNKITDTGHLDEIARAVRHAADR